MNNSFIMWVYLWDTNLVGGGWIITIKQGWNTCGSFHLDQSANCTICLQWWGWLWLKQLTKTMSGWYSRYTISWCTDLLYEYNYMWNCRQTFIFHIPSYTTGSRNKLNIYAWSSCFCLSSGYIYFNDSWCSTLYSFW